MTDVSSWREHERAAAFRPQLGAGFGNDSADLSTSVRDDPAEHEAGEELPHRMNLLCVNHIPALFDATLSSDLVHTANPRSPLQRHQASLDARLVPVEEQKKLIAILESTRTQIVEEK